MIVGYQGEPGAFSESAAVALVDGAETRGFRNFAALIDALVGGEIVFAVIPVENSIVGMLEEPRRLLSVHSLRVVDELTMEIEHCLIGTADSQVAGLRCVRSHPVALAQCRRYLAGLHGVVAEEAEDTAGAVREIAERGDAAVAAIAPKRAAATYGGRVLVRAIQDSATNRTRFCLVAVARATEVFSSPRS